MVVIGGGRVAGIVVGDAGVVMDDTEKLWLCFGVGDGEWRNKGELVVVVSLVVLVVAAG